MKEIYAKIVKKETDGITLKVGSQIQKISWDEFNANFDVDKDNKFLAWAKPEYREFIEKVEKCTVELISAIEIANRTLDPGLKIMYIEKIGKMTSVLQSLTKWSMEELMLYIKERRSSMMKSFFNEMTPKHRSHKKDKPKKVQTEPAKNFFGLSDENMDKLNRLKAEY